MLTLELLRRGAHAPLATCLESDLTLIARFVRGQGDFHEGVHALLISKPSRPASWKFTSPEQVRPAEGAVPSREMWRERAYRKNCAVLLCPSLAQVPLTLVEELLSDGPFRAAARPGNAGLQRSLTSVKAPPRLPSSPRGGAGGATPLPRL